MTRTEQLITTPFGAESTAAEVVAGIDLTGARAIVTGAGASCRCPRAGTFARKSRD